VRLAIAGAGAVGQSVLELAPAYGHDVVAIADSTSATLDPDGIDSESVLDRKRDTGRVGEAEPAAALTAEYDVLVEATPTTVGEAQPGFDHCSTALAADRHVVLANKGPVAQRYAELRALERESAGDVRFEATVGGAIPAIRTIEDYGPEKITAARGVLNGTANFILTRMAAEGLGYEDVLAEAQDLGVAEADPAFDVEGTDAALKGVIMANVLAGGDPEFTLADADVGGIRDIPGSALDLAAEEGQTIRLIGEATRDGVRVGPRLVPENGVLAVSGTTNIVQLDTEHAGQLNLSGRGAGGHETATAVLADIGRLP
jgi:homoserine dehydrogenase